MITIAGGGLAGLSLGIALRRAGVEVTIHEAGTYPRHRVCGEFISGVSERTIETLGLGDAFAGARRHRTMAMFSGDTCGFEGPLPEAAIGLSRLALDSRLAEKFQSLGGTLCIQSRCRPEIQEGHVWCIGRAAASSRWIGLKCHLRNLATKSDLEMHFGRGGYVGVAPVEDGKVNICGLFHIDSRLAGKGGEIMGAYMRAAGLARLAEAISGAEIEPGSFLGVAGFRLGWQAQRPGILSLGDACGMIAPFSGNGMSMAFESAELALAPLIEWSRKSLSWQMAVRNIHRAVHERFARRMRLSAILHPFLTNAPGQTLLAAMVSLRLVPIKSCFAALR